MDLQKTFIFQGGSPYPAPSCKTSVRKYLMPIRHSLCSSGVMFYTHDGTRTIDFSTYGLGEDFHKAGSSAPKWQICGLQSCKAMLRCTEPSAVSDFTRHWRNTRWTNTQDTTYLDRGNIFDLLTICTVMCQEPHIYIPQNLTHSETLLLRSQAAPCIPTRQIWRWDLTGSGLREWAMLCNLYFLDLM